MSRRRRHRRPAPSQAAAPASGLEAAAARVAPGGPDFRSDYDATIAKRNRRREPTSVLYLEDAHLPGGGRTTIGATAYDQQRNFVIAAWALRTHLDYVVKHTLQVRTEERSFNQALEAEWRAWSNDPEQYDSTGRHTHEDKMRLAEAARMNTGDIGLILRADGRVQSVESDRICDPVNGGYPVLPDGETILDGVHLDRDGRALAYAVHRRVMDGTVLEFERWVPAEWMRLYAEFFRPDQVRGISQLAPAINLGQDLAEANEIVGVNLKLKNLFTLAITREPVAEEPNRPDLFGSKKSGYREATEDEIEAARQRRRFDPMKGPAKLELEENQKIDLLESKTPSMESQSYIDRMIHMYLLAWDIPMTFYDIRGSTYSGARQQLLQYYQRIKRCRERVVTMSDWIFRWWLGRRIAAGLTVLPAGVTLHTLKHQWIAPGLPWIDPLKEEQAYSKAEEDGFTTAQRACMDLFGEDWDDVVERRAYERRRKQELGLPVITDKTDTTAKPIDPSVDTDPEKTPEQQETEIERQSA